MSECCFHSISWEQIDGWLCWGLTSQSTIFQSCRDGAIASWVINQYFRGVKCLAQGHNTAAVGLEPRTSRSGVRHSTTEPPRSPQIDGFWWNFVYAVLWLTHEIFSNFSTELWPLIDVKISNFLNIFSNNEWILIKFCLCIDIYIWSIVWLIYIIFANFSTE